MGCGRVCARRGRRDRVIGEWRRPDGGCQGRGGRRRHRTRCGHIHAHGRRRVPARRQGGDDPRPGRDGGRGRRQARHVNRHPPAALRLERECGRREHDVHRRLHAGRRRDGQLPPFADAALPRYGPQLPDRLQLPGRPRRNRAVWRTHRRLRVQQEPVLFRKEPQPRPRRRSLHVGRRHHQLHLHGERDARRGRRGVRARRIARRFLFLRQQGRAPCGLGAGRRGRHGRPAGRRKQHERQRPPKQVRRRVDLARRGEELDYPQQLDGKESVGRRFDFRQLR